MNKVQRKEIEKIFSELETLRERINDIYDVEQEKYDNLPENLYGSEKADHFEQVTDNLSQSVDNLDEILDLLNELI